MLISLQISVHHLLLLEMEWSTAQVKAPVFSHVTLGLHLVVVLLEDVKKMEHILGLSLHAYKVCYIMLQKN